LDIVAGNSEFALQAPLSCLYFPEKTHFRESRRDREKAPHASAK
jgi:hypothetical protein